MEIVHDSDSSHGDDVEPQTRSFADIIGSMQTLITRIEDSTEPSDPIFFLFKSRVPLLKKNVGNTVKIFHQVKSAFSKGKMPSTLVLFSLKALMMQLIMNIREIKPLIESAHECTKYDHPDAKIASATIAYTLQQYIGACHDMNEDLKTALGASKKGRSKKKGSGESLGSVSNAKMIITLVIGIALISLKLAMKHQQSQ
eukprot:gnl/Dysnectes_brevis/2778_a3385_1968.p1 GENE.gnl/Dysnectes_brevis/2778_a3385_1968~~gnl/Dysnectes_brevis/2778_a3385_1968.p1  ORF type:complete len:199 (-),score=12.44 gnl/Dysnectes_brevis/2778_a3385_1968:78-674(-)